MNPSFNGIEAFVAVAEEGSFRLAAARLSLTPGAVSRAISTLEDNVGVRLLNRTTRYVGLTVEGEVFLDRAQIALRALREGQQLLEMSHSQAVGDVTISLPEILADTVSSRLPALREHYPGITLTLEFTDEPARLSDDNVDIAVRVGDTEDSRLTTKLWLRARWVTVAAPTYLAQYGEPRTPDDLHHHVCASFKTFRGTIVNWSFRETRERDNSHFFEVPRSVVTTLGTQVLATVKRGVAVGQVFDFMIRDELETGELVEVLGEWGTRAPSVYILTRHQTPRVRAVLETLLV